jgi:hypothetical protein
MSLIPDKNLYIVTSALRPIMGNWSFEDRFNQTVASVKSIREKDPKCIILLADVSLSPVPDMEKQILGQLCEYYYDLSSQPDVVQLSSNAQKSAAENVLLFFTLLHLKNDPVLKQVKRIFKYSSRSILEDDFNAEEHNHFGKFIFKKRIPTWVNPPVSIADNLFITRLFSFCPSLIDTYLGVIQKNLNLLNQYPQLDTEHAHYANIPKEYLLEYDNLKVWGWLASGQIEKY